jgi:hypothetical protein
MAKRRPIIGVMGGSKVKASEATMAEQLGALVAQRGWVLLNGGRNKGVMAASARGAKQAGGIVIGVLPDRSDAKASPDLDYAIMTGMGDARNVINVLSSDVVIACPGALGTISEITLALKAKKTVILLTHDVGRAFDRFRRAGQLVDAATPDEAVALAGAALERKCRGSATSSASTVGLDD